MKRYYGKRYEDGVEVRVIDELGSRYVLLACFDVRDFGLQSQPGDLPMDFGNHGLGASQLALALLLDFGRYSTGPTLKFYRSLSRGLSFSWKVIVSS